jgi:hypothetical protein
MMQSYFDRAIIACSASDACKPESVLSRILRKVKADGSLEDDDLVSLKFDVFCNRFAFACCKEHSSLLVSVEVALQ